MKNKDINEQYLMKLRSHRIIYLLGFIISLVITIFKPIFSLAFICFCIAMIINCILEISAKKQVKINQDIEYEERKKRREVFLNQKRAEFSNELSSIPRIRIEKSDDKIKRQLVSDMPEIHFSNITRSTVLEKIFPLVCIDVETTGIQVRGNDIVEVSAIKYDVGFKPISCFTTLLKPRKSIPPEASQINNITDDMVKDSPSFSSIAVAFSDYISGCNIVGHNVMFDLRFLFVSGATLPSKVRYFDTLDLAKKTLKVYGKKKYDYHNNEYVEDDEYDIYDYKLETLCEYYSIFRDDAHRSLSDCFATVKVFKNIIDDKIS